MLDELFSCLTAWFAPIICFTAEEAWLARNPGDGESVHLRTWPDVPADWRDDALAAKWAKIRRARRVVTGALEIERAEKRIGSSLQAAPSVWVPADYAAALNDVDFAEITITSHVDIRTDAAPEGAFTVDEVPGVAVTPGLADGAKCDRCWQVLPDVGTNADHPEICGRCADAVAHLPAAAE